MKQEPFGRWLIAQHDRGDWVDGLANAARGDRAFPKDGEAEAELDALYLKRERGQAVCATCGQTLQAGARHLLTSAIADYLVARESRSSFSAIRPRLAHVTAYLGDTDRLATACEDVDPDWVDEFRAWATNVPIIAADKSERARSPSTIEASVRQLAAVINFAHSRKDTLFAAAFSAKPPKEVDRTPAYRADVKTLAAMFRYCLHPAPGSGALTVKRMRIDRGQLLRFLRISVATWARPRADEEAPAYRADRRAHGGAARCQLRSVLREGRLGAESLPSHAGRTEAARRR